MFSGRRSPRQDEEGGWVLVWFAIMLVVLLSMAAFAVDTSLWHYDQTKQQRAADAAALAGSVYLPGNPTKATSVALDVARVNGYAPGGDVVVTPIQVVGQPNQMKVTITDQAQNLFGVLMGNPKTKITKSGIATYDPPIAMGSPVNQIGNDPDSTATAGSDRYPNLWLNVAGPGSAKQKGDAYLATDCSSTADNCSGSNSDYSASGYYYTVHSNVAGPLTIQGFDPAFVSVGDTCPNNDGNINSNLVGAWNFANGNFNSMLAVPDWRVRYQPVANAASASDPGLRYCTGDMSFDKSQGPTTTYKVFGPASIPGEPSSAPTTPVCTKSFPGYAGDLAGTAPTGSSTGTGLQNTASASGAPDPLVKYFRQWYTLCNGINVAADSDYFVQITTSGGQGHNRFALRAGLGSTPNYAANDVNIYASSRMAIYANAGSGTTTRFHLARLLPGSDGRTLVLDLFDIGDASAPGSLTIVPPSDSGLTSFGNCTYTPVPGNSTGPPWGAATPITNCTIDNVSSANGYNGQWIEVRIPVPTGYTCRTDLATGCWVLIQYQFPNGIADTTSWTAHLDGEPVRLVG